MNPELKFEMTKADRERTFAKEQAQAPLTMKAVDGNLVPEALLDLLEEIVEANVNAKRGDSLVFTFWAYSFVPGDYVPDLRPADLQFRDQASIQVASDALRGDDLRAFFENAKAQGWDVTLSSDVERRIRNVFEPNGYMSTRMHIPMIDFACESESVFSDRADMGALDAADLEQLRDFRYFASGRSFHGYGTVLMSRDEWVPFMGKLLLLNVPGYTDVVDQRWVGHRLTKGYGALRWTKNNPKYLQVPDEIACPF